MYKRPNILLVLADQLRYDCVGYSRDYPVRTPNIDRLASQGTWFTNAFTPIPVCCPSRQSMLSGVRAETFGALWNYNNGLKTSALEPAHYNWVRDLADHGYQTGHVGKWSINPNHNPMDYGFRDFISEKEYDSFRKQKYPDVKYVNGFFGETDPIPVEDSRTHYLSKTAVEMIKRFSTQDTPWLVCIDFPEPHLPCRPAGNFAEMYKAGEVPPWRSFQDSFANKPYIQKQQLYSWNIQDFSWDDWAPIVARYYGTVSQVDDAFGNVLRYLDEMDLADNTVVIFSADHGDMCGGHRMMDKHYVLYDDIVKVPLAIRWPSGVKEGLMCSEFVCHSLDLAPTILEMAGLPLKEQFQGRSLLPLLNGECVPDWRQQIVATYNGQQFGLYTQRMLRTRKWKYIWNTTDVDELYDLEEDPEELVNLSLDARHKDILTELRKKLYEELLKNKDDLVVGNEWMKNQLWNGNKI